MVRQLVVAVALLSVGCQFRTFQHDPMMAAEKANEFAKVAFVDRNFGAAYQLLAPQFRGETSQERFVALLEELHSTGFPAEVEATDFGPILGQPAMSIFVHGTGSSGDIYYRLILQGTMDQGYAVAGFMRGDGEYPKAMRSCLANCGGQKGSSDAAPHN